MAHLFVVNEKGPPEGAVTALVLKIALLCLDSLLPPCFVFSENSALPVIRNVRGLPLNSMNARQGQEESQR